MFSIQQLRKNLYAIFKLMRDTGATFDIVYDNTVYELTVRKTNKKPVRTRAKKQRSKQVVQSLPVATCDTCDGLLVAGICMNTNCPTNS